MAEVANGRGQQANSSLPNSGWSFLKQSKCQRIVTEAVSRSSLLFLLLLLLLLLLILVSNSSDDPLGNLLTLLPFDVIH